MVPIPTRSIDLLTPHAHEYTRRQPMTSSTELLSGRYRLGRLLGRGGFSDVYLAVDELDNKDVAVKIVRSGDPELARRLSQEARALEGFEHPGLVRLLDTGVTGDQAYLVMEFVDGSNLAEKLCQGALTPLMTAALGATLADALSYVHARGIVHRDVKPANILVTPGGEARLGDFGIARLIDVSTLTLDGTTLGTAAYMAPEQLEDHQVGPSADIWSLGIVLLECMTGKRVYEGSPSEMIARRLAGPVPVPAALPVPWKLLLHGMLDPSPDGRLSTAEVAALLRSSPFAAPWDPSPSPTPDQVASTQPDDLTLVAPRSGLPAATAVMGDATAVMGDATRVTQQPVAPGRPVAPGPRPGHVRRVRIGALAAIVLVALGVGLAVALGSTGGTPKAGTSAHAGSTATSRPVPSTSSTTTTSAPTATQALASFAGDVASGVTAGTIDPKAGQAISTLADRAVTDGAAGKPSQAASDLQQAATAIAHGMEDGSIGQPQGAVLQADLSALAVALGLSAASALPISPPTTSSGPGAGSGNNGRSGKSN
jgi:predicted Ser/Thr protein kinase